MRIHKFPLTVERLQTISLNHGFSILTLQVQNNTPTIWAAVNPDNEFVDVTIEMYGTGDEIEGNQQYIGTAQVIDCLSGVQFVWHYFIRYIDLISQVRI